MYKSDSARKNAGRDKKPLLAKYGVASLENGVRQVFVARAVSVRGPRGWPRGVNPTSGRHAPSRCARRCKAASGAPRS